MKFIKSYLKEIENKLFAIFSLIFVLMLIFVASVDTKSNYNKINSSIQSKSTKEAKNRKTVNRSINKIKKVEIIKDCFGKKVSRKEKLAEGTEISIIKREKTHSKVMYKVKRLSETNYSHSNKSGVANKMQVSTVWVDNESVSKHAYKKIYLTFDDGPTPMTNKILKVLREENVKGTFFFNGAKSAKDKKIVKNIADEGHLLALHTYTHNYKNIYKNPNNFMKDLERNRKNFKDITGYDYVDWNVYPSDTDPKMSKKKYGKIVSQAKPGQENVVLLHVFDRHKSFPEGLRAAIRKLKKKGYEFDTVDNLGREVKFTPAK